MPRPALVLLPGMLCDERLFAPQLGGLEDVAAMTVADLSRDDSISGMAARVLATAPPRFALAGLSMGGIVAMEVLRVAPERVERVALLDTNYRPDPPERRPRRLAHIARAHAGGLEQLMTDDIAPTYLAAKHERTAELLALVRSMALDLGPNVFERQSRALMGRIDQTEALCRTTCPTLLLCGAEERVCPIERHREMARLMPHARLEIVGGAGHLPTIECPGAVNAALRDWL